MSLRKAFLDRLHTQFYSYLANHSTFKDWDTLTLYSLSLDIVSKKKNEINEYLDSKQFTIKDLDKATEIIIEKFLIPELERQRI